ncbi:MAG: hypothetical protein ABIU18_01890 [Novosphingobium sp.]
MIIARITIALSLLTVSGVALAHGSTKPLHGGMLIMVDGETQIEAVRLPEGLDIYVSEEDQPHDASGLEGSATVKDACAKPQVLTPMNGNRLRAVGLVPAAGQAVLVTIVDKATGMKTFATFQY